MAAIDGGVGDEDRGEGKGGERERGKLGSRGRI